MEDCIKKIDIEYLAADIKDIKFDKVLSFNYTNTYGKIYGINNQSIEYDYIHGKVDITRDASENNMVLGIDEYLDYDVKNKDLEFIAFKKYFQRIHKQTGAKYKEWLGFDNDIYVFGHSLDVTDKDILKELIENKNHTTTIFYYNKDVYAQQITNLVKVIGQDELIKRVSGANPTIIFKQQQKRVRRN